MKKLCSTCSLVAAAVAILIGCKGQNVDTVSEEIPVAGIEHVLEEVYDHDEPVPHNALYIDANDQMQFSGKELRAASGLIKLTLRHQGKMDKRVMGHNLVVLKPGTDIPGFALKAASAKDNDYIPKSEKHNIITHTRIIGGGESDTIEFTITQPGTYDFICSFPGHASLMKGVLIVE